MKTSGPVPLVPLFLMGMLLVGCPKPPPPPASAACDCTVYPFPAKCDAQCGITQALVESVSKDSVTLKMPPSQGQAAELRTIPLASLKLDPAALKAGASVSLTYQKSAAAPLAIQPGAIRSLVIPKAMPRAH